MTTELDAARTLLHDALVTGGMVSGAPAGLGAWRIHRTAPAQIAAPMVFLDSVELGWEPMDGGSRFVSATFPLVIVSDGTVKAQVEALDDLLAFCWDAAATVGEPLGSRPYALDVGGPSLRAQALRVQMFITARTLCPSTLATVGGT